MNLDAGDIIAGVVMVLIIAFGIVGIGYLFGIGLRMAGL